MKTKLLLVLLVIFMSSTIYSQTYSGGTGTETDPYLISSKTDLETLAQTVNNGSGNMYAGKYFSLTQDLYGITTVIGTSANFSGVFNGNGYAIDLNINTSTNAGLFGNAVNATIENLGITGNVTSSKSTGGICGWANLCTIMNCYNEATISSTASDAGGICGYGGSCNISNCYNIGNITSGGSYAGGISGCGSSAIIANCYNTGNVSLSSINNTSSVYVGGIAGSSGSYTVTVSNCFNIGEVTSSLNPSGYTEFKSYAGGISPMGNISNSYNIGNVTSLLKGVPSNVGRISTWDMSNNCYASPSVLVNGNAISSSNSSSKDGQDLDLSISVFQNQSWVETNLGWDFSNVWKMSETTSSKDGLPIFIYQIEDISTGVDNIKSKNEITIYSHSGILYINTEDKIEMMKIYNQSGVCAGSYINPTNQINLSSLPNGVYIVYISFGKKSVSQKVIISK
ncbi:T9SS type A sorting domain-containing protein [Dysgonomonas sp. 520]|uniref:T9SS type A sorting domain-containing protein n=1 Tax=Dysgonomonas sp. 520 TaxID=2302931 RepID=UPI0013D57449|nr:T9SS type A sorting domain-containing protein [Dysgonomonas sp. 520]